MSDRPPPGDGELCRHGHRYHEALGGAEAYCSNCSWRGEIPAKTGRSRSNPKRRRKRKPPQGGAVALSDLPPKARKQVREKL